MIYYVVPALSNDLRRTASSSIVPSNKAKNNVGIAVFRESAQVAEVLLQRNDNKETVQLLANLLLTGLLKVSILSLALTAPRCRIGTLVVFLTPVPERQIIYQIARYSGL